MDLIELAALGERFQIAQRNHEEAMEAARQAQQRVRETGAELYALDHQWSRETPSIIAALRARASENTRD